MDIFSIVATGMSLANSISSLLEGSDGNQDVVDGMAGLLGELAPQVATAIGEIFPDVDEKYRLAVAAIAKFNPDAVKWLQRSLNFVMGTNLAVDGDYGPRTQAAVKSFQEKWGLKIDGWAGEITRGLLNLLRLGFKVTSIIAPK